MDPAVVLGVGSVMALIGLGCLGVATVRAVRRDGVGRGRLTGPGVRGWYFVSLALGLGTLAFLLLALAP